MKSLRDRSVFLVALVALNVGCAPDVLAQTPGAPLRDPTQPPAALTPPAGVLRSLADTFKPEHLVTVGGVRYVVWNSRRYAVGATIQGARIERISETEVWLRGSDGLRKIPVFSGIEKRPPHSAAPVITPMPTRIDGKNGPSK